MHTDRIAQIIQFALAKARREDFGYGELGVIHLLKLIYLADLAHAQAYAGETYTGIPWVFFNFGPWDKSAWEYTAAVLDTPPIEAKVHVTGAFERRTFRFRDECEADAIFINLDRLLPREISREVGAAVHEFGADTKRLLHHVYSTAPMRATMPGDRIDFTGLPTPGVPAPLPTQPVTAPASKTQQKKAEDFRSRLRETIAARAATRQAARITPWPALNEKEAAALEELTLILSEDEDQGPTNLHGEMFFTPEFWRSDFRREHGLS